VNEVIGDRRKLQNEELYYNLFSSPNIITIKNYEMGGACSTNGRYEKWIGLQNFCWKTKPLGSSRGGWEDNIKMDLRDIGWEGVHFHVPECRDRWRLL
jgi:hypothetical protein